jgi:hypothetical protein
MPSVSPNNQIPVSYSTTIPGDTTLYYVQAVLRDTQSSTVLQTLNLKNVSSTPNRYTGAFNPVSDPSGLGRPVDVTISVYTDSGYTTLSNNYQILQLNYLVIQPWLPTLGSGGGLNIDYDKLQKMFDGAQVTNAEIGNEKAPRINYKRLEEGYTGAHEATRLALSTELKGHITNISSILSDISKAHGQSKEAVEARFSALEARIQRLDEDMGKGYEMSSEERLNTKNELVLALKEFREESKKYSEETPKNSEKLLKKAFAEVQDYLEQNLSEKEIKINYTPTSPKRKEEEKPRGITIEDVRSLFQK